MTYSSFSEVPLSAAFLEDTRTLLLPLPEHRPRPPRVQSCQEPALGPKGSMGHFTCGIVLWTDKLLCLQVYSPYWKVFSLTVLFWTLL